MRLADLLTLAWANLWRNRTRSLLTGVGVMVGTAALIMLLAYGSGLEQTANREFNALRLDNALRVTSHPIPGITGTRSSARPDSPRGRQRRVPLTDSLVRRMERIDGVLAAYPEMQFPAKLQGNGRTLVVTAEGIPMDFRTLAAYRPADGRFFATGDEAAVLIPRSMAERLGYQPATAAVGDTVDLVTASLNFQRLRRAAELFSGGLRTLPMGQRPYDVRIAGLLADAGRPVSGLTRVLLPLEFGRTLSKVPFFSTLDLLFRHAETQEGYAAVRVQLGETADPAAVRSTLDAMGVYTTSFRRQFERLDTLFFVLDLALGIIGSIALLVAVVGVANTILMNVRERAREIGIMMAVGGDARDLQRLFVVESGALGALGGTAGLIVGAVLATGLDWGINLYLDGLGVPSMTVFDLSAPMALAVGGGAVLVSLVAGVLPARRAARVEPAEALRTT
ncbi:MAG: ABC transporter permease [Salinibacter sp.]